MYTETVRWPGWLHMAIAAVVAIALLAAGRGLLREGLSLEALGLAPLALILGAVWWRFRKLVIEVGPGTVRFGFGRPGKVVERARIEGAETETYRAARYMGWGWRLGWEARDRAWSVLGCRRGVRLRYRDERDRLWKVFVSSRDPEALCAALDRQES